MREIRLYGSEGGGAVCSPYPLSWVERRVGPLSPCARFLPERADLEFYRGSPPLPRLGVFHPVTLVP